MLMPLNFLYPVTYSLIPTFHHWIYILLEDNIAVRTSVSNSVAHGDAKFTKGTKYKRQVQNRNGEMENGKNIKLLINPNLPS